MWNGISEKGIPLHLSHLRNRAQQGVDWKEKNMTKN